MLQQLSFIQKWSKVSKSSKEKGSYFFLSPEEEGENLPLLRPFFLLKESLAINPSKLSFGEALLGHVVPKEEQQYQENQWRDKGKHLEY